MLILPHGYHISRAVFAFLDRYPATNNFVEYEECILVLETTLKLGIKEIEILSDSNFLIRQTQGEWKTRGET